MKSQLRRFAFAAGCTGLLVAVTACGPAADGGGDDGAGEPFTAAPQSGLAGGLLPEERSLWAYDFETGTYEVVDGDASQDYVPNLRTPAKPVSIAYDDGFGGIPFTVAIKDNLERLAAEYGITIFYCDSQFKPEKAVGCAEQQVVKQPDFAIESNFQTGAAAAVMRVWDEAKIPAVNIDVAHPNGIFFGADNYMSGLIGGHAAGEYAKAQWDCENVTVLIGENPSEGEVANQRGAGFADGVQEICGKLPSAQIETVLLDAGSTDQAITKGTDWLTANPQAEHILATSIDDARAVGLAKAFVQNGRDGYAVGPGCDTIGVETLKAGPADETGLLGCVAFYPERYPEYLLSIALDVLEGKPVPQEVHIEHTFLDQESVGEVY
ncbi:MAG TPA: sugar ABC transporter substrate-binding protein [Pseudolysinimonas sp.]|nr:sugar ABC transporter substrate-binding protein [Pseudolysinimonas sp.]